MFSCFKKSEKKITTRGLFISAMSHVKLIAETRVYVCHKNKKSMGFFYSFSKFFCGKIYKNYSTGKKKWIESDIETIVPLQLAIHVVQNRQAGEQKPHWDKTNKRHTILNGSFLC